MVGKIMKLRLKSAAVMIVAGIVALTASPSVLAQGQTDFYSSNDILFYDPNSCSTTPNASSSLVGNDNLEKILRYFVGKGLTLAQAAGIAGNFQAESGFNPSIREGGQIVDETYTLEPGVGFGIAQWTTGGRQANLKSLATSSNRAINDLSLQLDFAWQEMEAGAMMDLSTFKATTTPNEAAYVFHRDFERSADTPEQVALNRGAKADTIYAQFKIVIPDSSSTTGQVSSALCTGDGKASAYTDDGFIVYNQNDPQWDKNPYGVSTIGAAGCGPSAMAMIITALTKQTVTPAQTAAYGATATPDNTLYNGGADGSKWNIASVIGKKWGLTATQLGGSVAEINTALRSGKLVITSGSGPSPYTQGGHFIVIRGVTADGKWKIGDSNSTIGIENSKKDWDPGFIMSNTATGNIWAVGK